MSALPIGTYVELIPGRETVYQHAVAGSRGWVRAVEVDEYDFEKVFIEWDKDHWRYDGELDMWTFADHFMPASKDPDLTEEELEQGEGPCPHCGDYHSLNSEIAEQYIDDIMEAFDQAADSDGFILFAICRERDPDSSQEFFLINTHRGATDPDLSRIPSSEILRFIEEQKRQRGE